MAGQHQTNLHSTQPGRTLDWFSKTDCPKAHIFRGQLTALNLQPGFGLHTLNATATQSFEVDNKRTPGVVLHCFLEGETEAWLDGRPMNLGRRSGDPVKLVLTSTHETLRFTRRSRPDEYVRKISIQMSHAWLDQHGLALPFLERSDHMQRKEWLATQDEIETLEGLAATTGFTQPLVRLQAEALSLGLVAQCFETFTSPSQLTTLTPLEQAQMCRIEDFARQSGRLPSIQALASVGGVSQSTLRRLIQAAHGLAPLAYVRKLRLEMARHALEEDRMSVEDAAALAGYASPSNFATAFRRCFDISPSHVRQRRSR